MSILDSSFNQVLVDLLNLFVVRLIPSALSFISVLLLSLVLHVLGNDLVVQVLEPLDELNGKQLVVSVTRPSSLLEWVLSDLEHLELVVETFQVCDSVVVLSQEVETD